MRLQLSSLIITEITLISLLYTENMKVCKLSRNDKLEALRMPYFWAIFVTGVVKFAGQFTSTRF